MAFGDDLEEGARLAEEIQGWISVDKIEPSKIAVLVSRQPELYAAPLMRELAAHGIRVSQ